jgi:hypothetical protein
MKWQWYLECKKCGNKTPISENDLPSGNFKYLNGRCNACGEYAVECECHFVGDKDGH